MRLACPIVVRILILRNGGTFDRDIHSSACVTQSLYHLPMNAPTCRIRLRVNPGFDPGADFWKALERESASAPQARGVFVFQLMDDGEIVVAYEDAVRFWRWASRRPGFSIPGKLGRGGIPAILFEPD